MIPPAPYAQTLKSILLEDNRRRQVLAYARDLALPDCWIGAGFIRNAVWDFLSDNKSRQLLGDVDVIWFDSNRINPEVDIEIEQRLIGIEPGISWSVKNQARMHTRNSDAPYTSCDTALSYWPETATSIAARLTAADEIEILAPYGLSDLFQGIVRPTPRFKKDKLHLFDERWREKRWLEMWPFLRVRVD